MRETIAVAPKRTSNRQHQRWLDFAQRFALNAWPAMTEKRKNRLRDEVTSFIEQYSEVTDPDWDGHPCIADEFHEYFDEYDERKWEGDWPVHSFINQLACCIRAGLDVACTPSAGVVGFTVGDIRRMYAGKIPKWIAKAYPDADFTNLDDSEGIWL